MRTMTLLAMLGTAVVIPRASFAHDRGHGGGHGGGGGWSHGGGGWNHGGGASWGHTSGGSWSHGGGASWGHTSGGSGNHGGGASWGHVGGSVGGWNRSGAIHVATPVWHGGGRGWGGGGYRVAPSRVFVPGYWSWRNHNRIWIDAAWATPPQPGAVWVAPQWVWDAASGQWVWREGYWSPPAAYSGYDGYNGYGG